MEKDKENASFPGLNLSEGEYLIRVITRHPIGALPALATGLAILVVLFVVWADLPYIATWLQIDVSTINLVYFSLIMLFLITVTSVVTFVAYFVYSNNRMFLTNESVIQEIQKTLFSHKGQTVNLLNVEDVSFKKQGVFQQAFNYGTVSLSTEGEQTNYDLSYARDPKGAADAINNAIEKINQNSPTSNDH